MKLSLPEFALQAGAAPAFTAGEVAPMTNPYAAPTAQLGEALTRAGGAVLEANDLLQRREDLATATEADNKLADATREILRSPQGYLTSLGRDARDRRQTTLEDLDRAQQRVLDTLSPRQRAYISRAAAARYQAARAAIDAHYSEQVQVYEIGQTEARATSLLQEAQDAYFAPALPRTDGQEPKQPVSPSAVADAASYFELTRDGALLELRRLAQLKGLPPEKAEVLTARARDDLYGSIVSRLADSGQALRAAEFVAQRAEEFTPDARAKALAEVRTAGVKEQGQRVATWLSGRDGDLAGRLTALRALVDDGTLTTEVADEAERRFLHFETVRREDRQRSDAEGLKAAQDWAQLHPGERLPESLAQGLGRNAATFELWQRRGAAAVDSYAGLLAAAAETPTSLARFDSAVELVSFYTKVGVSADTMKGLVADYTKARDKATAEATAAPTREDVRQAVLARLLQRGVFQAPLGQEKVAMRDNRLTERVASVVDAVMRGMPTGAVATQARIDEGLRAAFDLNATTVDGHVYPAAWLTNDEFGARASSALPGGEQFPASSFSTGGEGLRNVIPSTARTAGGALVDLRPTPDADAVLSREEATRLWLANNPGKTPTEADVNALQRDAQAMRVERKADAERIATVESKLEARAVLDALSDEVEKTLTKQRTRRQAVRSEVVGQEAEAAFARERAYALSHGLPEPERATFNVFGADVDRRLPAVDREQAIAEVLAQHRDLLLKVGGEDLLTRARFSLRFVEPSTHVKLQVTPEELAEVKALRARYKKTE